MAILISILSLICEAFIDVEKLPAALITAGGVLAAAVIKLVIDKAPRDFVFLQRREASFYFYYGTMGAVEIFGLMEALAGVWLTVTGDDLASRQAIGKAILGVSIFPLVIVASLGGFA